MDLVKYILGRRSEEEQEAEDNRQAAEAQERHLREQIIEAAQISQTLGCYYLDVLITVHRSPPHIHAATMNKELNGGHGVKYMATLEHSRDEYEKIAIVQSGFADSKVAALEGLQRAVDRWLGAEHDVREKQDHAKWERRATIGRNDNEDDQYMGETNDRKECLEDSEGSVSTEDSVDDQASSSSEQTHVQVGGDDQTAMVSYRIHN